MAEECNCSQEHDKAESLVEEKPQEEKKAEADDKEAVEDKNKDSRHLSK